MALIWRLVKLERFIEIPQNLRFEENPTYVIIDSSGGLLYRQTDRYWKTLNVNGPVYRGTYISSEVFVNESFVLAIHRDNPLATQATIRLKHLDKQPFIMYSMSAWQPYCELLAGMFRIENIQPNYIQYIGSTLTILSLVNTGIGIALVPESASRIKLENIVFRTIPLPQGIRSKLYLVWREDNDNPAFKVIFSLIKNMMVKNK